MGLGAACVTTSHTSCLICPPSLQKLELLRTGVGGPDPRRVSSSAGLRWQPPVRCPETQLPGWQARECGHSATFQPKGEAVVSLNCNSPWRARVDQMARGGTPPGLTGGSWNPPALGTSRGHHLATEPGRSLGRTLPCCLPQGQRRDLLTLLLPGQCPSWAPDAAPTALIAKINGRSLTLHLCPLLAGEEAQAQRRRSQGLVQGHTGPEALR